MKRILPILDWETFLGIILLALAAGFFTIYITGCASPPTSRLTSETVWPAASYLQQDVLVVEWPRGVKAGNIFTSDATSADGETRAESVAVLPPLTAATQPAVGQ